MAITYYISLFLPNNRFPCSIRPQCSFSILFCFCFGHLFSFDPSFQPQILPFVFYFLSYSSIVIVKVIVLLGVPIALTIVLVKCTFHSVFTCTNYCSLRTQCTIIKQRMSYTCTNSLLCQFIYTGAINFYS